MQEYSDIIKSRDESPLKLIAKQAGNMAAFIGLNMAFGAAGKLVAGAGAKVATASINHLARVGSKSTVINSAARTLGQIKAPTLTDVVKSLGVKVPTVPTEYKPIVNWAKEQVTALPAMMVIQNIDALSDGRKLSAKDLLIESVKADLLFRTGVKTLGVTANAIKSTSVYKNASSASWKPVQKFLEKVDLNLSYFFNQTQKYEGDFTYKPSPSKFNFNEINARYGAGRVMRSATNTLGSFLDTITASTNTKMNNKLEVLESMHKVISPGNLSDDVIKQVEKTFVKSPVNMAATSITEYYDNSYKDLKSSAITLGNMFMKAFQFEGVPLVNLLSAHSLTQDANAGFTKTNIIGDFKSNSRIVLPTTKGGLKGDSVEEIVSNILGNNVKDAKAMRINSDYSVFDELVAMNQNITTLRRGGLNISNNMIGVNSGSGLSLGFKMGESSNLTFLQIGSVKAFTGNADDATKYVVGSVIQRGNQAQIMRSTYLHGQVVPGQSHRDAIGLGSFEVDEIQPDELLFTNIRKRTSNLDDMINDLHSIENNSPLSQTKAEQIAEIHARSQRSNGEHISNAIEAIHRTELIDRSALKEIDELVYDKIENAGIWSSERFMKLSDADKHRVKYAYNVGLDKNTEINGTSILNQDYIRGIFYMDEMVNPSAVIDVSLLNKDNSKFLARLSYHKRIETGGLEDIAKAVKNRATDPNYSSNMIISYDEIFTEQIKDKIIDHSSLSFDLHTMGLNMDEVSSLSKTGRVKTKLFKKYLKEVEFIDPDHPELIMYMAENERTMFTAATGIMENNTIKPIDLEEMGKNSFENMYTVTNIFEDSAIMSVNDLAKSFKMDIDLNGQESMMSYMSGLISSNIGTVMKVGAAGVAAEMLFRSGLFSGSPLEDGMLPFVATGYNELKSAGTYIANKTHISDVARAIENTMPGLISSPLGGAILSVAPILMGVSHGANSGSFSQLAISTGLGIAASGILGGFGASVLGDYDVTMTNEEAYAIASGEESVAIRKGRFWGLSSGSFWGQNVQYYRNSAATNSILLPTSTGDLNGDLMTQATDFIGLTNPVSRNRYSRPYLDNETQGSGAFISGNNGAYTGAGIGNTNGFLDTANFGTNLYGLRGFVAKDALLGNLNPTLTNTSYIPRIASADSAYGLGRQFWNLNAGGMFGQTEYIRRLLPKSNASNEINPLRNTMPNWLPGDDYFINFKEGDPYTKIQEGEIRLPGSGHLSSNPVNLSLVLDLDLMGHLNDEDTINYSIYGDPKTQDENINGQLLKKQYMESAKNTASMMGSTLNEAPSYYSGNNIIASADFELQGNAVKVETVSQRTFLEASKSGGQNYYQNKADLLATISNKNSEVVIIDSSSGSQKIFKGRANPELLRNEARRLYKLQPKIIKKMKQEGRGIQNLYSIVDRFKVLADVAPYSKEYRNYEKIIKKMAKNGELNSEQIKDAAKAIKKRETVVRGLTTADGKGSILSELLPSKVLAPDQIDPLVAYRENQIYSSGQKRWEAPLDYFKDDFALSVSGKFNPIKRGIGSSILYGFVYGPQGAALGASTAIGTSLVSGLTGGIEMRETYDKTREVLLKQSALEYARNIQSGNNRANTYNLYNSMANGGVDPDRVANSMSRVDRSYFEAFKNIDDEQYRQEVLQSVDPSMAHVLDGVYGTGAQIDRQSFEEASRFIEGIPDNSILYDSGVDTDYLVIRELERQGIDPRNIGKNFDQEKYQMTQSAYSHLDFTNYDIQSIEQQVTKRLSKVVKGRVKVTDFNVPGEKNIHVVIING